MQFSRFNLAAYQCELEIWRMQEVPNILFILMLSSNSLFFESPVLQIQRHAVMSSLFLIGPSYEVQMCFHIHVNNLQLHFTLMCFLNDPLFLEVRELSKSVSYL